MLQMMMMPYFKIKILFFTLLLFVLAVSCADIDTETSGYASLKINLDDVSSRKNGRSQLLTKKANCWINWTVWMN